MLRIPSSSGDLCHYINLHDIALIKVTEEGTAAEERLVCFSLIDLLYMSAHISKTSPVCNCLYAESV